MNLGFEEQVSALDTDSLSHFSSLRLSPSDIVYILLSLHKSIVSQQKVISLLIKYIDAKLETEYASPDRHDRSLRNELRKSKVRKRYDG